MESQDTGDMLSGASKGGARAEALQNALRVVEEAIGEVLKLGVGDIKG